MLGDSAWVPKLAILIFGILIFPRLRGPKIGDLNISQQQHLPILIFPSNLFRSSYFPTVFFDLNISQQHNCLFLKNQQHCSNNIRFLRRGGVVWGDFVFVEDESRSFSTRSFFVCFARGFWDQNNSKRGLCPRTPVAGRPEGLRKVGL